MTDQPAPTQPVSKESVQGVKSNDTVKVGLLALSLVFLSLSFVVDSPRIPEYVVFSVMSLWILLIGILFSN